MPLTAKGEEIKGALTKEYGEKKGEQVLYAGKNKGTFTGIDSDTLNRIADAVGRLVARFDAMCAKRDSDESIRKAALAKVTLAHPTNPGRTEEFKKTLERALTIAARTPNQNDPRGGRSLSSPG
jgi:hypothetical protein